ncbi:hypothetical protein A11S_1709 [Micavibrio aeruginosavorus EPB]|uniref:Uncharacterized protein n=1 Tax=Micavibrio aeruginosavorus EPB TaxID=349215 RepID=M4VKB4_9BACT|nr:hypothetical protein A11S_1709 [Micavibrio aeruginosavorus EPB]
MGFFKIFLWIGVPANAGIHAPHPSESPFSREFRARVEKNKSQSAHAN